MDRLSTFHLIALVPLLAALIVAAVIDARTRRIPNWLSLPLLVCGITQSFLSGHLVGPMDSVLGLLAGFGLTFFPFALDAMGGGDVKLLSAVGAWVGPETVLAIFCVEAILGMAVVLCQAIVQGRLKLLARNTAVVAISMMHLNEVGAEHVAETGKNCRSIDRPLPFAVPVLAATVLVMVIRWHGGLL